MKQLLLIAIATLFFISCDTKVKVETTKAGTPDIVGTWQLLSGRVATGKDTTYTDYTKDQKMIKILNGTHFAFLRHDLTNGKQPEPIYAAGAGTYKLDGNKYAEHLEFFNLREWENHDFNFTIEIRNDTLFQSGIEKIDSLGVNQEILETYVRVRQ